jgi:hypothetical protein
VTVGKSAEDRATSFAKVVASLTPRGLLIRLSCHVLGYRDDEASGNK